MKDKGKKKCQTCGKPAIEGFWLACSKECAEIHSQKYIKEVAKMCAKLPKVSLTL